MAVDESWSWNVPTGSNWFRSGSEVRKFGSFEEFVQKTSSNEREKGGGSLIGTEATYEFLRYVGKYAQVFDGSVNMDWLTGDIMEVQVNNIVRANSTPKNTVFKALTEGSEVMAKNME
jgi:hypothetical protein